MLRPDVQPTPTTFADTWLADLATAPASRPWLWHGYLAPGAVTLLTSLWKAGKTTLLSLVLNRLRDGGELAGLAVQPARAVVVSEESVDLWRLRQEKIGFGPHVCWICRPFRGRPSAEAWQALIDHILELRLAHGIDLAVIDPLAAFLPSRTESEPTSVLNALLPLQQLTAQKMAVWLLHHPRKKGRPDSCWARGSGAMTGFVDILMEMDYYASPSDPDRRRKLWAYSRFDATPRCRIIELNEAGTDYRSLGDLAEEAALTGLQRLTAILDASAKKLTRREILEQWPAEEPPPAASTLWRWLDQAVAQGQIFASGAGTPANPFRYWNQSLEQKWQADPKLRRRSEDADLLRKSLGVDFEE